MQELVKNIVRRLPLLGRIIYEHEKLKSDLKLWRQGFVPPGHFYSPLPDIEYIRSHDKTIFADHSPNFPGINMQDQEQLRMLDILATFYAEIPFDREKKTSLRYYFDNGYYSYSDAICYYAMLRYLKPGRCVEIGSGYSSCLALDTSELFLKGSTDFTFIDPYPERLFDLLRPEDKRSSKIEILRKKVQEVPIKVFESLSENDVLFIDSSHVSKVGSDVNYIFFEILPALKPGVLIHIHDVFFPFEYPSNWIYGGRSWNEIYLLRAFLQFNSQFEIVYFNTFVESFYRDKVKEKMPLCLVKSTDDRVTTGSIWLRRK